MRFRHDCNKVQKRFRRISKGKCPLSEDWTERLHNSHWITNFRATTPYRARKNKLERSACKICSGWEFTTVHLHLCRNISQKEVGVGVYPKVGIYPTRYSMCVAHLGYDLDFEGPVDRDRCVVKRCGVLKKMPIRWCIVIYVTLITPCSLPYCLDSYFVFWLIDFDQTSIRLLWRLMFFLPFFLVLKGDVMKESAKLAMSWIRSHASLVSLVFTNLTYWLC